jgi:hypothetical protein
MDEENGSFVFYHACQLALKGIVSKRTESLEKN